MSRHSSACVLPKQGTKHQHCTMCHETFSSPGVGDRHRVAAEVDHQGKRMSYRNRCLTPAEMTAAGLVCGEDRIWRGMPAANGWDPRGETHTRSTRGSAQHGEQAARVVQPTPTARGGATA